MSVHIDECEFLPEHPDLHMQHGRGAAVARTLGQRLSDICRLDVAVCWPPTALFIQLSHY